VEENDDDGRKKGETLTSNSGSSNVNNKSSTMISNANANVSTLGKGSSSSSDGKKDAGDEKIKDGLERNEMARKDGDKKPKGNNSPKSREEQDTMVFKQALRHLTESTEKELIELGSEDTQTETVLDTQEMNDLTNQYRDILKPLKLFHLSDIMEVEDEKYEYPSVSGGALKALQIMNEEITHEMEGLDVVEDAGTYIRDLLLTACDLGGNRPHAEQLNMATQ